MLLYQLYSYIAVNFPQDGKSFGHVIFIEDNKIKASSKYVILSFIKVKMINLSFDFASEKKYDFNNIRSLSKKQNN